jgi:DNA-directed RNA polymerase specialized sigma24 family protein
LKALLPPVLPPLEPPAPKPIKLPPGLVAFFEGLTKVSEWLAQAATRLYEIAQVEPWRSRLLAIAEIILAWPRDKYGRPLEPEEFHPGFAAMRAVERADKRPQELDNYLERWLDIDNPSDDHRRALWLIVSREAERPVSKSTGWILDATRTQRYLGTAVRKLAWRIERDRDVEDKPWGLKRLHVKQLPEQCEFVPELHSGWEDDPAEDVGLTNAEVFAMLSEFQREELERRRLKELEDALPERQYQVLALRAEGYTHKAIGKELGITDGASKSHLAKARKNPDVQRWAEGWM